MSRLRRHSPFRRRKQSSEEMPLKTSLGAPHIVDPIQASSTGYLEQVAGHWGTSVSSRARKSIDELGAMAATSEYVPDFIKDMLPNQDEESKANAAPASRKDIVLWVHMDVDPEDSATRVLIGYTDGFQVWKVDERQKRLREIVSVRDENVSVRSVRYLNDPLPQAAAASTEECPLDTARPLLAVSSAVDSTQFPRCCVKVFSIPLHQYAHVLRFKSPVLGVRSNHNYVIVAVAHAIYSFSSRTLNHAFSVASYPSPTSAVDGVLAVGAVWLAYPSSDPNAGKVAVSGSGSAGARTQNASGVGCDEDGTYSVSALAKDLSTGLYYLGSVGKAALSRVLQPEPPSASSGKSATSGHLRGHKSAEGKEGESPTPGFVVIRNFDTRHVVARFRSQKEPLAALQFDPSGTLLATASLTGQTIHVHRILVGPTLSQSGQELLYRLERGLTHAVIRTISFSSDIRWLSATSSHGTTHLFPISIMGGRPNAATHDAMQSHEDAAEAIDADKTIYSSSPTLSDTVTWSLKGNEGVAVTVRPLGRIRESVGSAHASSDAFSPGPGGKLSASRALVTDEGLPIPISTIMRGACIFTISAEGKLVEHSSTPVCGVEGTLDMRLDAVRCWDICRIDTWGDVNAPRTPDACARSPSSAPGSPSIGIRRGSSSDNDWMAQVETCSHKANPVPLWSLPQFRFFTFSTDGIGKSSQSEGGPLFIESLPCEEVEVAGGGSAPAVVHGHADAPGSKDVVTELIKAAMTTPTSFKSVSL